MVFLPLPTPLPLPFASTLCADFVLGFLVLGVTGMHEGKCADLDLVVGLPACCGPIHHKTLYNLSNFVATSKITIKC